MSARMLHVVRSERRVRVRVPATTSNLGPGFDVLGLALTLYCELEVTFFEERVRPGEASVYIRGEGADSLPRDNTNLIVDSFRRINSYSHQFTFRIKNEIPLGRGLGSSAAARLCGLFAANAVNATWNLRHEELESWHPNPDEIEKIMGIACEMEGHPDNAVPAFHGGLRVCLQEGRDLLHYACEVPKDLGVVVCVPDFMVSTEEARAVLPGKVPLSDAVRTASRVTFLLEAIQKRRYAWLKTAMQDVLHQPYRKKLVRGMDRVIRAAMEAGAHGAALSGSGSSILAFTPVGPAQAKIGRAMQRAFFQNGAESRYLAPDIDREGARVEVH